MIIYDEPAEQYHRSGSYGVHSLLIHEKKGPEAFRLRCVTHAIETPRSEAMVVGTLAHALILEGEEKYLAQVAIQPMTYLGPESAKKDAPMVEKPWNGNANICRDWTAERQAEGKLVVSADQDANIRAMWRSVLGHPDASPLLRSGVPEVTIRATEEGVPLQCRPDLMSGGAHPSDWTHRVELKTCDDLDGFEKDVFDYQYDRQCAFYDWMLAQEGVIVPCHIIAVEKRAPHRVGVYRLDKEALERAHRLNEYMIEQVAATLENNPDQTAPWPRGDVRLKTLGLPNYLREQWQQARHAIASI